MTAQAPPPSVPSLKKQLAARRRAASYYRAQEMPEDHFYPSYNEELADQFELSADRLAIAIEESEVV